MTAGGIAERHALTLLWKVENFSFYDRKLHSSKMLTPPLTTPMVPSQWVLRLFPRGRNKEDGHLYISLNALSEEPYYPIDCEFSILAGNGFSLVTRTVRNHLIDRFIPILMPDCPTYEELFVSRKSEFLSNDTLTVRCRIWKSQGNFKCPEHIFLHSRIELSVEYLEWPIQSFWHLPLDVKVTTVVDVRVKEIDMPITLQFSFRGSSLEEAAAQIELASSLMRKLSATLKVSVLDSKGKAVKSAEAKHLFHQSANGVNWILPKFITRRELLAKKDDCLSSDVLTLLFEVTFVGDISHFLKTTNHTPSDLTTNVARKVSVCSDISCKSSVTLGEDLLSLYRDHTGSDFELRSGDVSFPVHKPVLMARSPVFRAMFSSNMKESNTNSLEVPDVDAHTLNRMLTFLYAGTMDPELEWEDAAKLYYAAEKYQVQSLKQRCCSVLQSSISVSNVAHVLTLADRHQDQELTSIVHDFFLRRFDEVMLSEEWDGFHERNPILAGTTLKQVCKKKVQMTRSQ